MRKNYKFFPYLFDGKNFHIQYLCSKYPIFSIFLLFNMQCMVCFCYHMLMEYINTQRNISCLLLVAKKAELIAFPFVAILLHSTQYTHIVISLYLSFFKITSIYEDLMDYIPFLSNKFKNFIHLVKIKSRKYNSKVIFILFHWNKVAHIQLA